MVPTVPRALTLSASTIHPRGKTALHGPEETSSPPSARNELRGCRKYIPECNVQVELHDAFYTPNVSPSLPATHSRKLLKRAKAEKEEGGKLLGARQCAGERVCCKTLFQTFWVFLFRLYRSPPPSHFLFQNWKSHVWWWTRGWQGRSPPMRSIQDGLNVVDTTAHSKLK